MRSPVCANHFRFLCRASALVAVTALAACSSDASRFEQQLTTATTLTANQQSIIKQTQPVAQPYPDDNVETTNGIQVSQPDSARYGGTQKRESSIKRQPLNAVSTTASAPIRVSKPDPEVVEYAPTKNSGVVLPPRSQEKPKLRLVGVDPTSTGSVGTKSEPAAETQTLKQPKANTDTIAKPTGETKKGWTKAGGTWVTVGSGETLYNLSRRYGVPVRAIMNANDISNAKSVAAGSRVLIPTYNFSSSAPVSAPDNDPVTKVSRASRGFQGQVQNGKIALPKPRVARVQASANKVDDIKTGSVKSEAQSQSGIVKRAVAADSQSIAARATEVVKNPAKTKSGAFRWPAQGRVIAKFGERKRNGANDGIDISVPVGTPIKASENGTVIYSGSELEEFGNLILLSHKGGWVSAYGNASSRMVKRGDKVRRGQVIAKSGKSGNATVPQLHFELRKNSKPVNPLNHLQKG